MRLWSQATYTSVAHNVYRHAERHGYEEGADRYLRMLTDAERFHNTHVAPQVQRNGELRPNAGQRVQSQGVGTRRFDVSGHGEMVTDEAGNIVFFDPR